MLICVLLQLIKIQANYHRQSLKELEQVLPLLTEEIGLCRVVFSLFPSTE